MRVLVIVPAFNEAKSLPRVIASLRQHAPMCDVAVVDDGSTDDTAQVAAAMGVCVLRSPVNLGIGGAVQTGYLWARDHDYDAAVQIDGDGQHDPSFIASTLVPIERDEAELVIGSRFRHEQGFRSTPIRRAGIRYLAWFLRLRCGARITDPTSGFRAVGRKALDLFARQYPSDYPEPESVAFALRAGLRVSEVPVRMHEREHGHSSIDAWKTIYYLVKVSLALLFLPVRSHRPPSPGREPRR